MRGWPKQPSLMELENSLVNQKELAKQMESITIKEKEEEVVRSRRPTRGGEYMVLIFFFAKTEFYAEL